MKLAFTFYRKHLNEGSLFNLGPSRYLVGSRADGLLNIQMQSRDKRMVVQRNRFQVNLDASWARSN